MKLINNIKEHRGRLKITQESLAKAISCNRMTLNKIERGVSSPCLITALKIADAFEVSIHDVFKIK